MTNQIVTCPVSKSTEESHTHTTSRDHFSGGDDLHRRVAELERGLARQRSSARVWRAATLGLLGSAVFLGAGGQPPRDMHVETLTARTIQVKDSTGVTRVELTGERAGERQGSVVISSMETEKNPNQTGLFLGYDEKKPVMRVIGVSDKDGKFASAMYGPESAYMVDKSGNKGWYQASLFTVIEADGARGSFSAAGVMVSDGKGKRADYLNHSAQIASEKKNTIIGAGHASMRDGAGAESSLSSSTLYFNGNKKSTGSMGADGLLFSRTDEPDSCFVTNWGVRVKNGIGQSASFGTSRGGFVGMTLSRANSSPPDLG